MSSSSEEEAHLFKGIFNQLYKYDAIAISGQDRTWWFENLCNPASREELREHRTFALLLAHLIYNEQK
jgi:hypothetical protein